MNGRRLGGLLVLALLAGPMAGGAAGLQRVTDERGEVETAEREAAAPPSYIPQPWEVSGVELPLLSDDVVPLVSEDDEQLRFVTGGELGQFRPAPPGGTPFFGTGQPIFGLAAPPVLPSRVLRPLGSGDGGDRFLGQRPPVDPTTVIPKLGETFDQRRESFAFIGEIPPIPERTSGSPPFPFPETVEDGIRDLEETDPPEAEPTDPPGAPPTPTPTFQPGPPPPPGESPPTGEPPTGTTVPTTTTTATTTTTTTTTPPTTTTTTTTTAPTTTTTTTTAPTTSTTTTTTTTTTTAPPTPTPEPPPVVGTAFVLGNQRNSGTQCYSNATGGTHNADCDRLFDFGGADGFMEPGESYAVNLTLWNVGGQSDTDAVDLRGYSPTLCTPTTTAAGAPGDLCEAVEITIQRYSDAGRTNPVQCVYGGGSASNCSFSSSRTLGAFARSHTSMGNGAKVVPNIFRVNDRAFLRITVRLPDRGVDPTTGFGRSNPFSGQRATWSVRWEMRSA